MSSERPPVAVRNGRSVGGYLTLGITALILGGCFDPLVEDPGTRDNASVPSVAPPATVTPGGTPIVSSSVSPMGPLPTDSPVTTTPSASPGTAATLPADMGTSVATTTTATPPPSGPSGSGEATNEGFGPAGDASGETEPLPDGGVAATFDAQVDGAP